MRASFAVRAWSALAPGLQDQDQWRRWSAAPTLPPGKAKAELPHVPAMARRRLGHLAKMAVCVADAVLPPAAGADLPVVWASRYGDADKALWLLDAQASDQALSPTAFGLSVHNGIGAQHSILRGMRANAVCVAASQGAPEAGAVEAAGLLNDGAPQVLLVCYDAPLAGDYACFHDEPVAEFAWALLLAPPAPGEPGFTLKALDAMPVVDEGAAMGTAGLPHGLDVLHFVLESGRAGLAYRHAAGQWLWGRTDG